MMNLYDIDSKHGRCYKCIGRFYYDCSYAGSVTVIIQTQNNIEVQLSLFESHWMLQYQNIWRQALQEIESYEKGFLFPCGCFANAMCEAKELRQLEWNQLEQQALSELQKEGLL